MKTYQNDTYGELTEAEHQRLRATAHPCIKCGMLATVDPAFHAARYAHQPAIRENGQTLTWHAGRWTREPSRGWTRDGLPEHSYYGAG